MGQVLADYGGLRLVRRIVLCVAVRMCPRPYAGMKLSTDGILRSLEQVPETGRWRFMDISPKYEAKVCITACAVSSMFE